MFGGRRGVDILIADQKRVTLVWARPGWRVWSGLPPSAPMEKTVSRADQTFATIADAVEYLNQTTRENQSTRESRR
jgi:hypothetical protein